MKPRLEPLPLTDEDWVLVWGFWARLRAGKPYWSHLHAQYMHADRRDADLMLMLTDELCFICDRPSVDRCRLCHLYVCSLCAEHEGASCCDEFNITNFP